jgi:protein-disulfide isomerase
MTDAQTSPPAQSKDGVFIGKDTVYIASVIVLVLLLAVSVFTGGFSGVLGKGIVTGNKTVTQETALTDAQLEAMTSSYINANFMSNGLTATVVKIEDYREGIKLVTINIMSGTSILQSAPVYVTVDGKVIFPAAYLTNESKAANQDQPQTPATFKEPDKLTTMPSMNPGKSITVVEFSDFQCPFCGLAYGSPWAETAPAQYAPIIGTVQKLENEYVKTGKVTFTHYPVAFLGAESTYASNAALCAMDQGKYWEMHEAIFNIQTKEENNGKYNPDKLKLLAKNITGLNLTQFDACVDAGTHNADVVSLTQAASESATVNSNGLSTPTFYVLVDATTTTADKVSSAAKLGGYSSGLTEDGKYYLIVADPTYSSLSKVLSALAG